MMSLRRGLMAQMAGEKWTYEIYPTDGNDNLIQAIQTKVEVGQTVTISWDADSGYAVQTNRYLWRCIGAILDSSGTGYASRTMAQMSGQKGTETHIVTTAGNILFGGYGNGFTNSFIGKFIKVRIEPSVS